VAPADGPDACPTSPAAQAVSPKLTTFKANNNRRARNEWAGVMPSSINGHNRVCDRAAPERSDLERVGSGLGLSRA
jgi:hypothetical protein